MRQSARFAARDLTPLFAPASVAVVGASNDRSKYGHWISAHALAAQDARRVHLVSRRGEPVLGRPTHRRVVDVDDEIDLVVIAVPATGFDEAVDDALAAGARAIVGITAGFGELGGDGAVREAEVVRRVRGAGAVLLGPNCLGVADTGTRLLLSSNAFPPGTIGVISQSGNVALELGSFLEERGLGVSRFASLGNQADLTATDVLRSYAEHPGTAAIAVYCEDFRDGRAFATAAADAVAAGKRVVLLTVGAGRASVRSARSHTGALTTDAAVVRAACEAAGIDLVRSPREAADLLALAHAGRLPRGRRIAVIADGGGHAGLVSDLAEAHGLEVRPFEPSLARTLRAALPPSAAADNPVDLAGAPERDVTIFARTLARVLAAPDVDAAVVSGWFGGYGEYGPELAAAELATAKEMGALAAAAAKPVLLHTMAPAGPAAAVLRAAGVPVFRAAEDGIRALAALAADRSSPGVPALPPPAAPVPEDGYWAARGLVAGAGLAVPAGRRVTGADDAAAAAAELGGPVVLKALGVLHKSDVGGVALDLRTPGAVRAAYAAMDARLHAPGYCVERMADTRDAVELIAGVRRDPRFGPVALLGLGGVFAEVLGDVAFALAPVDAPAPARWWTGSRARRCCTARGAARPSTSTRWPPPWPRSRRSRPPIPSSPSSRSTRCSRAPTDARRSTPASCSPRPPRRPRQELTMDFAYTPRLSELKRRAVELAERILPVRGGVRAAGRPVGGGPRRHPERGARVRPAGDQHAGGVGRGRAHRPRAGRRAGGAGQAHRRAVGLRVAAGQRAARLHARAARALPPPGHPRRAARRRGDHGGARGLGPAGRRHDRDPGRRRLAHRRREVVRHGRRRRRTSSSCCARTAPGGEPTMFLVDKDLPGVRLVRMPRYTHTFVYEHPEIALEGVRVGPDAVLGEVGGGYELTRDWFTEERLMIGARTIGAADRALTLAAEWARTRVQGGARLDRPAADRRHAGRLGRGDRHEPRPDPPGRVGVRPRRQPQDPSRAGGDGQAGRVGGLQPRRRPLRADLRRPRLHAREPSGAPVARAARRPHLGGHLRDPAPRDRERDRQAGPARAARLRGGAGARAGVSSVEHAVAAARPAVSRTAFHEGPAWPPPARRVSLPGA